ncbi:unnamed protein product [Calypogeia fissa]
MFSATLCGQPKRFEGPATPMYERLLSFRMVATTPFVRITYTDANEVLRKVKKNKFVNKVEWGIDLASEHERYLTEQIYQKPVIVLLVYLNSSVEVMLRVFFLHFCKIKLGHQQFIRDLNRHCKDSVRDHLIAVTSPYTHQIKCSWESSNPTMFGLASLGSGFPQVSSTPFSLEAQDGKDPMQLYTDVVNDIEEEENFPPQGSQMDCLNVETLSPGKGERCPLKESQQTVPETPSLEQRQPSKQKEYAISNGQLNLSKKKGAAGLRLHNLNGGTKPDLYQ